VDYIIAYILRLRYYAMLRHYASLASHYLLMPPRRLIRYASRYYATHIYFIAAAPRQLLYIDNTPLLYYQQQASLR